MVRMVDRKLNVRYDPEQPANWFIPDDIIEGCKVEQKMSSHLIRYYPKG
jgi:hypothetical protein